MDLAKLHRSTEPGGGTAEASEPDLHAGPAAAAVPSSKSQSGPGCSGQTDAKATRQARVHPLQSPSLAGSRHQGLLVSRRACARVCMSVSAHRRWRMCTQIPRARRPGVPPVPLPLAASGLGFLAREENAFCWLTSFLQVPQSVASACDASVPPQPAPRGSFHLDESGRKL